MFNTFTSFDSRIDALEESAKVLSGELAAEAAGLMERLEQVRTSQVRLTKLIK